MGSLSVSDFENLDFQIFGFFLPQKMIKYWNKEPAEHGDVAEW